MHTQWQFLVSLKFGISLVVPLAVSLRDISIILFQQRHKQVTRKLLCASRRPGIVIKFWRRILREVDSGDDVTKSRRRERSRRFVSSLLTFTRRKFSDDDGDPKEDAWKTSIHAHFTFEFHN